MPASSGAVTSGIPTKVAGDLGRALEMVALLPLCRY